MTLDVGQVVNERYRISQMISQGVHSAVYRAWDLQNQSPCALKERLDPNLAEKELFRSESTRLFTLDHPGLARIYDFFAIPGQGEYLVMEFVEGEDLHALQEKARQSGNARLSEAQVLPWLMQVSDALGYLHNQNPPILHGDIKPENIRFTAQGEAVLVDLGFSHLTSLGTRIAGMGREVTPGYSAPEQYGASPLDPRVDVYALGATLYTLLTGALPPDSVDIMSGAASLIPARQLNPQISPDADRLIQQSMQANRNARLPDMRAFKNALSADYSRIVATPPMSGATIPAGAAVAAGATLASATTGQSAGSPSTGKIAPPPPKAASAGGAALPERRLNRVLIIAILIVLLVCLVIPGVWFVLSRRSSPGGAGVAGTQAAQTVEVQITQNAALTATAGAIQTALATQFPGTPSPLPPTATPTSTIVPATPTQAFCGKASFVADVTVPDNTVMNPGTAFTKVWRIRNDSSCTWNTNYALVFAGGSPMTNQLTAPFPGSIAPGQAADLSLDLTAPQAYGTVQGNWLLRTDNNVTFGVSGAANPLFVNIIVTAPIQPDPRFVYDFSANYCNAQWRTAAGVISCNNISSDVRGSALALALAPLERGQENEAGLWVRPDQNRDGFIVGEYPNYTIQVSDHFVAEVGCVLNSTGCNVSFQVDIQPEGGNSTNLGVWNETYDGKTTIVDIDLTPYAGQTVHFLLRMLTNGQPAQANGLWFLPSIRNEPSPPTATVPPILTPTVAP